MKLRAAIVAAMLLVTTTHAAGPAGKPSHKAADHCAWEKFSDAALGLEAWVQRCDYGTSKSEFIADGTYLSQRYTDGTPLEHEVDVIDLRPGETPEAGIKRFFTENSDKAVVPHCVLAPLPKGYGEIKTRADVKRYHFVAEAAYGKKMRARNDPGDIPDPLCGEWGDDADSLSYFEAQPASGARKVLFVNLGQDEPQFDYQTLRLLPVPSP
jgi:hypothetical protein